MFRKSLLLLLVVGLLLPVPASAKKRARKKSLTLDPTTAVQVKDVIDRGLRSGNMKTRGKAYRALALAPRNKKEIQAALVDGLKDPQPHVVAGVIGGMINLKMKGYEESLIKIMARRELNWSDSITPLLKQLPQKQAISTVLSALNAKALQGKNRIASEALQMDQAFAVNLVFAAEKSGGEAKEKIFASLADASAPTAMTLYPTLAKKGSAEIQRIVLGSINKIPEDVDRGFLSPLLRASDTAVKESAAMLLATQGNVSAANLLLPKATADGTSAEERTKLLVAIQGAVKKNMLPSLEPLLDPTRNMTAEERGAVYGCYAKAGDASVLAVAEADINGTDGNARAAATRWLGTFGGTARLPQLKELIIDGNFKVRMNAAFSLGELRTTEAISTLQQGLNDVRPEVKLEAVRALAKVKNNEVAEILQYLVFDQSREVRKETIQILRESRHVATLTSLKNALQDADTELRLAALIAIMTTDLTEGQDSLKRSLIWLRPGQVMEVARQLGDEYTSFAVIPLQSRRKTIREEGMRALRYLKPSIADPILASLSATTPHSDIRGAALLASAKSDFAGTFPGLQKTITDPASSAENLQFTLEALAVGPSSKEVMDTISIGLMDPRESFQVDAALALLQVFRR